MGSNFEEDEEDTEGATDAFKGTTLEDVMADAEGVVDAFVDTDMDALKSNNANKGVNMGDLKVVSDCSDLLLNYYHFTTLEKLKKEIGKGSLKSNKKKQHTLHNHWESFLELAVYTGLEDKNNDKVDGIEHKLKIICANPVFRLAIRDGFFHGKNYKSSSDYEFGSGNRSNELGMETFFVEDANIDNIEENDEMYDILHDIYGPQIHAQQSNLGNDTVSPNMEDGEIDGIATLLSEAKKMLFLGAMLFLLKFIMKLLHIKDCYSNGCYSNGYNTTLF
ncbi:hypothetical protein WN944_027037 [Citrus x changshan-huyou]|uniref:Uncharacterized protein n=1 Tax=Citrus x changshan-huyou TaxID=2935761 RepID=A0AAP0LJ85_9ROSI